MGKIRDAWVASCHLRFSSENIDRDWYAYRASFLVGSFLVCCPFQIWKCVKPLDQYYRFQSLSLLAESKNGYSLLNSCHNHPSPGIVQGHYGCETTRSRFQIKKSKRIKCTYIGTMGQKCFGNHSSASARSICRLDKHSEVSFTTYNLPRIHLFLVQDALHMFSSLFQSELIYPIRSINSRVHQLVDNTRSKENK